MNQKILFVDDDVNLLASLERNLRNRFQIQTMNSGQEALARLEQEGPYAVVVADRQMPGMDGIEFLGKFRLRSPDTIRIMLTGLADLEGVVRVVNEGNIFRFLTKPCPIEVLTKALLDAQAQYRLVTAEKELLNKTLSGSIKLLTDILSMVDTQSFGRAQRLRTAIASITSRLQITNAWEVHLAAMLAPIGYIAIPAETLAKFRADQPLSHAEEQMLARVPQTAARLLANIPRLEGVARIVEYQDKHFDGSGTPPDAVAGETIPLGARLLKILQDLMQAQAKGLTTPEAFEQMQARQGWYDPALLTSLEASSPTASGTRTDAAHLSASLRLKELAPGMILRSNVETKDGLLVLTAGYQLNEMTLEKLRNFQRLIGIKEPILVESVQAGEADRESQAAS